MIRSPFFNINTLKFDRPLEKVYAAIDSFVIYICLDGEIHFIYDGVEEILKKGETMLKPAELTEMALIPTKPSEILEVFVDEQRESLL